MLYVEEHVSVGRQRFSLSTEKEAGQIRDMPQSVTLRFWTNRIHAP